MKSSKHVEPVSVDVTMIKKFEFHSSTLISFQTIKVHESIVGYWSNVIMIKYSFI